MDLTRRYRFAAMHRLHASGLSDSDNQQIYGKCNNPHGHGHNYLLEVTVRGPVEQQSGQVLDRQQLDGLVEKSVLGPFSHADLNRLMEDVPTSENLASEIRMRLEKGWRESFAAEGPRLSRIRLYETRKNICEVDAND